MVSPRGGGSSSAEDLGARARPRPTAPASTPEIGEGDDLLRLLLGAHDPLERRVARLVDRVGDGDDGRKRRLDHVVAVLGLALRPAPCRRRARASPPARSSAAGAGRRPRPRGRRRRSRRPAGRRGRGRGSRARPRRRARRLVATRSEPAAASSVTSTSRSAPIASALRSDSAAPLGPIERTTTSVSASPSFTGSASSSACVSKSFSAPSPLRSRRSDEGSIRFGAAASGTSFTQTAIFTAASIAAPCEAGRSRPDRLSCYRSALRAHAPEHMLIATGRQPEAPFSPSSSPGRLPDPQERRFRSRSSSRSSGRRATRTTSAPRAARAAIRGTT